jgi:hypothetical protein
MIAEISVTGHVEKYHVSRDITDSLNRILMRDISASSAFSSEKTANALIEATVTRNKERIQCWAVTAPANSVLPLNCTFTKTDATNLGVPIQHIGVMADPSTNRLRPRRTRTVTVVIIKRDNEQGWSIYTAFPNVHEPYGTDIKKDLIPLLPACDAFHRMPEIARVFSIERCMPDDWKIAYDIAAASIRFDIVENGQKLGTVSMNKTMSSWETPHEDPIRLQRGVGEWLIERALPETHTKAKRLRDTLQKLESHTMFRYDENEQLKPKPIQIVSEAEPTTTMLQTNPTLKQAKERADAQAKRQEALTQRATKKALARSKAANKRNKQKNKPVAKKKPSKAKPKTQVQNQPYKPTRVMTKLEENGLTQHEQNVEFIMQCLAHGIPLINADTLELIIDCYPDGDTKEIRRLKGIRVMTITQSVYDQAMLEWDSDNNPSYRNVYIPKTLQMIQNCTMEGCTIYGPFDENGKLPRLNLEEIADDINWQPFVSESMRKWIDTRCVDPYGRDVNRICEESDSESIIEKLRLTIGDYAETANKILKQYQDDNEASKLKKALIDTEIPTPPKGPIDIHDAIRQSRAQNPLRASWNNPLASLRDPLSDK